MITTLIECPFGKRAIIWADYTASGRPYKKIEKFIKYNVLQYYANVHSNAYCGKLMAKYISQSKEQIKKSVNAADSDKIIFTGSGTSCAITHFIHLLNLTNDKNNIIIISEFEHNSNFLPWRHIHAKLEIIKSLENGLLDLDELEIKLKKYRDYDNKIISCSAGSNITGIKQDISKISVLGHKYGFIVGFDYAAVGPYVKINMHKDDQYDYIDALYLSPHKFLGGPGTPGLLIANEKIFKNDYPYYPSGGTVRFTSKKCNIYANNLETKESGGTPNIIGCIKAGLVFQLKDKMQTLITLREHQITCQIKNKLKEIKSIHLLNPDCDKLIEQIPIFSFIIPNLHYNFAVALLNDLFGIQTRGGVSCSGIYAEKLLHIGKTYEQKILNTIISNKGVPQEYGWIRVTFHFTMPDYINDYIVKAIHFVADNGHLFLKLYSYDKVANLWKHKNFIEKEPIYDFENIQNQKCIIFDESLVKTYLNFANNAIKKI